MLTTADNPLSPVLLKTADVGEPCLVCGDDCPGLEIHFWRKICINCKCAVSDHQARSSLEGRVPARRGKQLDDNVRAQFECGNYSWIPTGLSPEQVEEYMKQLPPEQRPYVGTVGEQFRRKLLMTQLPSHDHSPSDKLSKGQSEELREFSRLRYEMSHGVGEVRVVTTQQADMFDCRTCQSPLMADQLCILTSRAGPACIWCISCFKCDVCTEPLVDLHYFYKDGELFCGRHHAELLKPRCNACDELILAKEYTLAEERNWHIDHFCCWECDSPLGGQRYVTRDDHPFCILCYEELFAPPCKKCSIPIGLDSAHMVHRDYHWHATDSCFFCQNCQVSLITSPFLFKYEEIFCSSTCSHEFTVAQLADTAYNQVPLIEIIEDNPVDRSRVLSILRKDSSPSPPKENGFKTRKVMFDVVKDEPSRETKDDSDIKRTYSEEEFEFFEQSLIENHGLESATLEFKKLDPPLSPVLLIPSPEEPLSESSLSNTPLSDRDTSPFLTSPDSSCQDSPPAPNLDSRPSPNLDSLHNLQFSVKEQIGTATTLSDSIQPDLTESGKSEPVEIESVVETQEMLTAEIDNQVACTEKSAKKEELVLEDVKPVDSEVIVQVTECGDGSMESGGKENSAPSRTRNLSDNDVEDMKPKKSSLSRNKPSSASFNRVLRKLDNSANDTLATDRPGKRLKNRPRSMSSLSTHSRAQNVLEQRDNLINMYALAPDIADMMASVYQTTSSISTTTQVVPDPEENRTLGDSPSACSTLSDTPRATGMVRRNPSYEAAEFVMQMGGESDDDEGNPNVSTTKHVTLPNESDHTAAIPDKANQKSPKKGIKERLSFKKKKNKGPQSEPQSATNLELSPSKRRTKKACVVM